MGKYTGEPYQPSNGTEGMAFTEEYCMNCLHCDPNPDGPKQCRILCASMCFSPGEEGYPKEWMYDENDNPSCTNWQKWDWGNDGDPDDPENPNAPPPPIPDNQLCLPFIFDEIGINLKTKAIIILLIAALITGCSANRRNSRHGCINDPANFFKYHKR